MLLHNIKCFIKKNIFKKNKYFSIAQSYNRYADFQKAKYCSYESSIKKWKEGQKRFIYRFFSKINRHTKILDIACGDGVGLKTFKKLGFSNVIGIDFSQKKIERANKYGYPVFQLDMHDLRKVKTRYFDVIYSSHTLEHAYSPIQAIQQLRRVLKNSGKLYVILPYPDIGNWDDEAHGAKYQLGTDIEDNGKTVIDFFEKCGFEVTKTVIDFFRQPEIWLICRKKKLTVFQHLIIKSQIIIDRLIITKQKVIETYYRCNHLRFFYTKHFFSYLMRNKTINYYINSHKIKKLQLSCGEYPLEGWLNTELYGQTNQVPLNLLKKFPLQDNSFDYIFLEHTIEHFSFLDGKKILNECYRVLKNNGTVRIATPDLQFLIDIYKQNKSIIQKRYIKWSTEEFHLPHKGFESVFVINNYVRAWGHQFIYNFTALKVLLSEIGFSKITKCEINKSQDVNLQNLESHWKSIGNDFNNLETFCVEASKI